MSARDVGCAACPDMRTGSCFDGKHLFCERHGVWTNLLDDRYRGHCLDDRDERDEPYQPSLF